MNRSARIELDTPIVPEIIAWCVWDEAAVWLGELLPRGWLRELTAEANTVYARCKRFRQGIRRKGNRGRDYLWMFMRHWLAAKLYESRPQLHARMPASYNLGQELPARPGRDVSPPMNRSADRQIGSSQSGMKPGRSGDRRANRFGSGERFAKRTRTTKRSKQRGSRVGRSRLKPIPVHGAEEDELRFHLFD